MRRILPAFVWRGLRSLKTLLVMGVRRTFELAGFTISRVDDYYSPLISTSRLKERVARWNHPSSLGGVEYDLEKMKSELSDLLARYLDEFRAIPPYAELQKIGFGPGYTAVDALTLYMMVRQAKPKRYIEVGSGLSTYYCSLAAEKNANEGHPLEMTCIEPHPFDKLRTIPGINLIAKEVQDVDPSVFQQLEKDDFLFIDSSHILNIDGDVPFLYLEVLPRLNVGVVTHIHDVPFPYNTPYPAEQWIFKQNWPMLWNEAMLLQAFLSFNPRFKITLSTPLIRHFDEAFLKSRIPFYETLAQNANTFSSLWLSRVA